MIFAKNANGLPYVRVDNRRQQTMKITAEQIHDKALSLGFFACGIIKAESVADYEDYLNKRIKRFPETAAFHVRMQNFAYPTKSEPWIKSIIVCVNHYGRYFIPAEMQGRIGKSFLTDSRTEPQSDAHQAGILFKDFLTQSGIKNSSSSMTAGNTAMRHAAVKSGLGIIRKNNFLYTQHGSWVWLESWFIDQEMEYINQTNLPPCPENCTRCIDACATQALVEPYQINPMRCIARMTWSAPPVPEDLRLGMKGWLYGCDDCQDCCPMNHNKWTQDETFPGLDKVCQAITPEQLFTLDDDATKDLLVSKFKYITRDNLWKWKVNALRVMAYAYKPAYQPYIEQACHDENEWVRDMAEWAKRGVKVDESI
jgi:epoxyqueuosine reductase